jgi:hypothetical protein
MLHLCTRMQHQCCDIEQVYHVEKLGPSRVFIALGTYHVQAIFAMLQNIYTRIKLILLHNHLLPNQRASIFFMRNSLGIIFFEIIFRNVSLENAEHSGCLLESKILSIGQTLLYSLERIKQQVHTIHTYISINVTKCRWRTFETSWALFDARFVVTIGVFWTINIVIATFNAILEDKYNLYNIKGFQSLATFNTCQRTM